MNEGAKSDAVDVVLHLGPEVSRAPPSPGRLLPSSRAGLLRWITSEAHVPCRLSRLAPQCALLSSDMSSVMYPESGTLLV